MWAKVIIRVMGKVVKGKNEDYKISENKMGHIIAWGVLGCVYTAFCSKLRMGFILSRTSIVTQLS